jgi:hypothetical protein
VVIGSKAEGSATSVLFIRNRQRRDIDEGTAAGLGKIAGFAVPHGGNPEAFLVEENIPGEECRRGCQHKAGDRHDAVTRAPGLGCGHRGLVFDLDRIGRGFGSFGHGFVLSLAGRRHGQSRCSLHCISEFGKSIFAWGLFGRLAQRLVDDRGLLDRHFEFGIGARPVTANQPQIAGFLETVNQGP